MEIDIKQLVAEMQANARQHVYDPEDFHKGIMVDDSCKRDFVYEGVPVVIVLSLMRSEGHSFWSLSINRLDFGPMEEKSCQTLAKHFFLPVSEAGPVVITPPNPLLPNQMQFGQLIP